jgi:acylphosphatase
MSAAIRAIVRGRVQGVGFRWFVVREARRLDVRGYARNLDDGGVEVVAVGDAAAVERLRARLQAGPPGARVDGVAVDVLEPPPAFEAFEIRV